MRIMMATAHDGTPPAAAVPGPTACPLYTIRERSE